MMKRSSLVHILKIGIHAQWKEIFDLFNGIIIAFLDDFDDGSLIVDIVEVDLTFVLQ